MAAAITATCRPDIESMWTRPAAAYRSRISVGICRWSAMRSARARGASSPKVRSIDRAALALTRESRPSSLRGAAMRAVGRWAGGLDAAMIAAAANTRTSAIRSARARSIARRSTTEATAMATQANSPNPRSRPPRKTRYVAVMSGSVAPVAHRRSLVSHCPPRGIIPGTAQSKRAGFSLYG